MPEFSPTTKALAPHELRGSAVSGVWLVVRKRRFLLLLVSILFAILGMSAALYRGKRYTATGELQIQPGSASDLKQSISAALTGESGTLDVVIESDIEILKSDKLLSGLVRTLKLQDDPTFLNNQTVINTASFGKNLVPLLHGDLNNPYVHDAILRILRAHLTIARLPRTQMVSISYTSRSPQLSANIVNSLETAFIENNFTAHYGTTQQVTKWLTGQIDDLRSVVQTSQNRMVDLQKSLGISALNPSQSEIVQEMADLEKSVAAATEQRVLVDARYQILKSLSPDQIQDSPTSLGTDGPQGLLASLRAQRASAVSDLARLKVIYGPNHPQVKQLAAQSQALDKEISKQEQRVINQAKDASQIATAAEDQARSMLDAKAGDLFAKRDDIVKYQLLAQEYDSNRHMYESIIARLREAAVDAGLDAADISVVDLAALPVFPSSMSPAQVGMIGFFFGAMGGVTIALFIEKMDTRLRDAEFIQQLLELPPLAIIPQANWKPLLTAGADSQDRPEFLRDPNSAFSEGFRILRTSLQLSSASRQSRVIAITSSQPSEGKSTVAANIAAALAQAGKRVLLLDADMRRPSLYQRLALTGTKGLSGVLTDLYQLDDVIRTHEKLSTLDFISSGIRPPLPADLLGSKSMEELIRELRSRYDYVIMDTPPTLSVTDPAIIASQADGVILVIRQGYCTRRMLLRVYEVFRNLDAKMYGFVFNGVDPTLPEYYGYQGYYSYKDDV